MKTIIIIPARMASQRFPNKPMALIDGIPMIQRVWEKAKLANIGEVVTGFGGFGGLGRDLHISFKFLEVPILSRSDCRRRSCRTRRRRGGRRGPRRR